MQNFKGQFIGRYHVIEKLGAGGMAEVYRAFDTRLEREVAIKFIRRDAVPQSEWVNMLRRFEREAKALARLSFPNIVPVHDYGEHEGVPYVVMEYISGGTLKQRLGKPVPFAIAAGLLLPVAHALEYAHQKGIIHRDVKPANVLITESGIPMLSDFGIAKILNTDQTTALTGTGVGIGTPDYMAPEQWTGDADQRSDIYSLGIIFFELITGQRPYIADTPAAVLLKHVSDPLPRPATLVPGLPPEVEKVLYKALAKKPAERFQEMGEFAAALENLAGLGRGPQFAGSVATAGAVNAPAPKSAAAAPNTAAAASNIAAAATAAATKWASRPAEIASPSAPIQPPAGTRVYTQPRQNSSVPLLLGGISIGLIGIFAIALLVGGYLLLVKPRLDSNKASPTAAAEVIEDTPILQDTPILIASPTAAEIVRTGTPSLEPSFTPTASPTYTQTLASPTPSFTPSITATEIPAIHPGTTRIASKDGMVLVYVPEGESRMGSDDNKDNEKPQHDVYLDAFWIDQTEVTNRMFTLFVDETGYRTDAETLGKAWVFTEEDWQQIEGADWQHPHGPSSNISSLKDHPVVQVSWNDAAAYCSWAGRRLPSEAEWEKAARGTDGRTYPWGGTSPNGSLLNMADANIDLEWSDASVDDGYRYTAPVGSYPSGASPYGILDIGGNVYEWVNDWYNETYYSEAPSRNPLGPDSGTHKVMRGGSYFTSGWSARTYGRDWRVSNLGLEYLGIRCAVTP